MKKYTIMLVIILSLFSCKETMDVPADGLNLYFEGPQPVSDSEIQKIPASFLGFYQEDESSYLRVEQNAVLWDYHLKFKIHKNFVDSLKVNFKLADGKMIDKKTNEAYTVSDSGDSLLLDNISTDTLFKFSGTQKAKRINGQLVLSTKDSTYWKIKTLTAHKDKLTMRFFYSKEDRNRMDSVTKIKARKLDSTSYVLNPSRSELKKILKLKRLGEEHSFKKIRAKNNNTI